MTEERIISAYTARYLIGYLTKSKIDMQNYYNKTDTLPYILLDDSKWITLSTWVELLKYAQKKLNKSVEDIAYESTLAHFDKPSIRLTVLVHTPLVVLSKIFQLLLKRGINKTLLGSLEVNSNNVTVRLSFDKPEYFSKELCDYNYGVIKAVVKLRGVSADVVHTACIYRNSMECIYRIDVNTETYTKVLSNGSIPISANDIELALQQEPQWPLKK